MINSAPNFYQQISKSFPFEPTENQEESLKNLSQFIFEDGKKNLYILKGYAGTGKTTLISVLVNNLWRAGKKAVLLAPTGRAAKVITSYSKKKAFTIHKKIYFPKKEKGGAVKFVKQVNKHTDTLFIVDEASMISDTSTNTQLFDNGSLLDDLVSYVYSGRNCKILFVGDTAQLPPVKMELSPALETDSLGFGYDMEVLNNELTQVTRQSSNSGILVNATEIRGLLNDSENLIFEDFKFDLNFKDIIRLEDGYDIENALVDAYGDHGVEETAFIVRSNKRANQYNQQIRLKIRGQEDEISTGDYLMVVKNNYFWLDNKSEAGFIANGDTVEVMAIRGIKELYGFRFAEVTLRMVDYQTQKPFDTVVLLDTVTAESPSLTYEDSNRLYQEVAKDYVHEKAKYKQYLAIKNNKYFNALQVKFAYSMTCHKSQGGQWDTVFIEKPYLPDGQSVPYLRWLYTAITRAKNKLYLIGFKDEDFH